MTIRIFYDGECPFCNRYVHLLRLQEAHGAPEFVDLRQHLNELPNLLDRGFDPDQGMAISINENWYFGHQAAHILAGLSTPFTAFNRVNRILFSSPMLARWTYPVLRAGRNAALFFLGRKRLRETSNAEIASLVFFNSAWGLFAVLHAISYAFFSYGSETYLSTVLIGFLGAALIWKPSSMRIFSGLLFTLILDACMQPPLNSNHTIIKNFLLLAMSIAAVRQVWRGGGWADFYADFAPVGRALLVTMYIFGIFHKINRDFLDPAVSCAVVLWRAMPPPLSYLDSPAIHQLSIYGTFVAEGVILGMLIFRRTRHWGVASGIAFHSLLALSGYAMYVQFSMLTIALHMLFIERQDAVQIQSSKPWQQAQFKLHTKRGSFAFGAWLALLTLLGWNSGYTEISIVWMPSVLFLAWLCVTVQRYSNGAVPETVKLRSPALLANLVSLLFFLNCAAPYLGLKTSQSINMFANLQLEGGRSNHLILSNPPGPFDYLSDIVTVTASSGSSIFSYVRSEGLKLTYYQLLDEIERNPGASVSFEREGRVLVRQNKFTLSSEIEKKLQPRWFRYWFHFSVVDLKSPKPCAIDR